MMLRSLGCQFAVSSQKLFSSRIVVYGKVALKRFNETSLERKTISRLLSSNVPAMTSSDGVVGTPINFDVASKIEGNESQIVTIKLLPGEVLRAESGAMMYMTEGVTMNTTTGGGMSAGFQRWLTGQNVFISDYQYEGQEGTCGTVALGTDFPSKILRLSVGEYGGKIICQQGALLCASHTIDIEVEFTKNLTSGFFGGEGFVLQALKGDGDIFVKAGGTLIRRDLAEDEELRISSGCLVGFTEGVDYGKYFKFSYKHDFVFPLIFCGYAVCLL